MKTKLSPLQFSLMLLCAFNLQPSTACAQGTAFTYQGRLSDGANPAQGIYDLRFAIYDSSGGLTSIAGPVTNSPTTVSNGLFTVTLDFGAGVFTGAERWLEVAVRTNGGAPFTALSPRQKLTPTPYAIFAGGAQAATSVAAGGVNSAALATGAVGGAAIADGAIAAQDLSPGLLNNTFWRLGGNAGTTPGTHFLGTTDNQPLEFKANNARALRLEPTATSPNLVGGHAGNSVAPGMDAVVIAGGGRAGGANHAGAELTVIGGGWANTNHGGGATLGGGYLNRIEPVAYDSVLMGGRENVIQNGAAQTTLSGGLANVISNGADYASISGGQFNLAGATEATVAGGGHNRALGFASAVGGGGGNAASGLWSAIAGGRDNAVGTAADYAAVGGGSQNQIGTNSANSTVGGGDANGIGANSIASTISGGVANDVAADSSYATIAGGAGNYIRSSSSISAIGGGMFNGIFNQNTNATIGGGHNNVIWQDSSYSTIAGGEKNDIDTTSPHSAIAGGQNNDIGPNSHHSVITGGENNDIGPDAWHSVIGGGSVNVIETRARATTVSGGLGNTVEDGSWLSTIGGGFENVIGTNSVSSTIGGGWFNSAVRSFATIPGGFANHVAGQVAFAAGRKAHALHDYSFVWSSRDNLAPSFSAHRFHVHAAQGLSVDYAGQRGDGGGERWIVLGGLSDFPGQTISTWTGARLTDGGVWADNSDRNTKENLTPVNPSEILERVASLPVQGWNYKVEGPEVRHIGPMAQDFYAAFGTGHDDKHLAALDSAGVALAAIQGLNQKLEASQRENSALQERVEKLEKLLQKLVNE
ncbi:MAG: tail fiber domain-containing protein [Verrucomicrobia subdivision 3 bacterium]|nr:tail fiber domain-containing protein [Limisphaerales bacterium]